MNPFQALKTLVAASVFIASMAETPAGAAPRDVIDPGGNEDFGYLFIPAPQAPANQLVQHSVSYRGATVQPGEKTQRLKPGTGCVEIATTLASFVGQFKTQFCNIEILPKKTTEFDLFAKLARVHIFDIQVPRAVGFGPTLEIKTQYVGSSKSELAFSDLSNDRGKIAYFAPGTWQYEFSREYQPVTFTFEAGKATDLKLSLPDRRATVNLVSPERVLPTSLPKLDYCNPSGNYYCNVGGTTAAFSATTYLSLAWENQPAFAQLLEVPDTSKSYKVFSLKPEEGAYVLTLNQNTLRFQVEPSQTKTLTWKRVDVNHPIVTLENGTQIKVNGTYRVFLSQPGTQTWELVRPIGRFYTRPNCQYESWKGQYNCPDVGVKYTPVASVTPGLPLDLNYATGTGLDLLPGSTYKVIVTFKTALNEEVREYILNY